MKIIILLNLFLVLHVSILAQNSSEKSSKPIAKKPTIMVKPSLVWLNKNNFTARIDNQGSEVTVPNYEKALNENIDLKLAIATINNLYNDRSYPLKSLEQTLKNINQENSEIVNISSKSGSTISEGVLDLIRRTANADIELDLTWEVKTNGPYNSITFILEALDTYSGKAIASVSGIGQPSLTSNIQILLKEAVLQNVDNLNSQLQNHFNDLIENGREVSLKISVFSDSEIDIETEVQTSDDKLSLELGEAIENWLSKNTINKQFNTINATDRNMSFEQVRIPLFMNDTPLDSRKFFRGLVNYLLTLEPKVASKLISKGLGDARIIIGGK
jgi:hypothetical protein